MWNDGFRDMIIRTVSFVAKQYAVAQGKRDSPYVSQKVLKQFLKWD